MRPDQEIFEEATMSHHYQYLIIGAGMTADAAVQGIREVDAQGTIGVVGAEMDRPYNRPPLTKGLWKGDSLESIWRKETEGHADLHLGRTIKALDLWRRQVTDDRGGTIGFDKLLLATGGTPRRLPFGGDDIIYYRTVRDYLRVRELTQKGKRFAVLGGGFIGSEIAAALALNRKEVIMLFPGMAVGARMFPRDLSLHLNSYYEEHGVELRPGSRACGVE
ncbi:MAG TPA: FAD/NAD(P)-binding oxidoreductase, partial [Verrucomicrobiae bacterium]|nr:FAD/NAD(P)-binding oxidoreductase [Verrucomicrobiae bacterium]